MATIRNNVTKKIISEVHLFGSIMQQNVIKNKVNREYVPLATNQPRKAIKFKITGLNDIYLDLNNSRLHVFAKITKTNGKNIDANTAAPIKLTLQTKFREIDVELTSENVLKTSQLYQYRSFVESLLNFKKRLKELDFCANTKQRTQQET